MGEEYGTLLDLALYLDSSWSVYYHVLPLLSDKDWVPSALP